MTSPRTPAFEARPAATSPAKPAVTGVLRWTNGETPCAFGRSGLVPAAVKREGDGATPIGSWAMRQVFYRPDRLERPQSVLPVTAITPDMGWCDDPAHPAYNRAVALPFPASHEILWRADGLYDLIVTLGYNDDPPVPDMGSAIFFHCAAPDLTPTEGCIAIAREQLTTLIPTIRAGDTLRIGHAPSPA